MAEKPRRRVQITIVEDSNNVNENSELIGICEAQMKRKLEQNNESTSNSEENHANLSKKQKLDLESVEENSDIEETKLKEKKTNKKDKIYEITEGNSSKKVILAEKKTKNSFRIDWTKYIIPSTETRKEIKPIKRITKHESSPSTSTQFIETDSQSEYYDPKKMPKMPSTGKRKRNFQKKDQTKVLPKYAMSEKYSNDFENQIQIKIETAQSTKNTKHVNKTLLNFFEEQKLTYRMVKRVNLILKMVKQDKIIIDTLKILKVIREEELQEGYSVGVDKKSIVRLLLKLSEYGLVKYRKATLKSDRNEKKITFICDINVDDEDSVINSVLEQSKMKDFIMKKEEEPEKIVKTEPEKIDEPIPDKPVEESFLDEKDTNSVYKYNRNISKKYGFCPKFARCHILHEFLFYIVYDKQSEPISEIHEIDKIFQGHGSALEIFENSTFAPIYNRDISWRMFIPPLKENPLWSKGWIILSDILLRLPLYILTSCFNIPYEIPSLEEYLAHPIRRNFLIKNLPPVIRNGIVYGKKLTYILIENLKNLCYLGLIQFGPQKIKHKEQQFIYLNHKTCLYNTVTSTPGYYKVSDDIEYDRIDYTFNSLQDIEQYWYDMWSISINTALGYRSSVNGTYVVIENSYTKPELIECLKSKTQEEAIKLDVGYIPGDKKGAAGFDSSLFTHIKRNWNWLNGMPFGTDAQSVTNIIKKVKKEPPKIEEKKEVPKEVVIKKENGTQPKPKKYKVKPKERKPKKKLVVVKPLKPKKKKLEYDEKDQISLSKMRKLRTDWYDVEDHILLLCAVASTYLCPNYRKQRIEQYVFRDVLHKMVPCSYDKTSRAIHRRIRYIMKNPKTSNSVCMCLEEIKHCDYVIEKFGSLIKKYQNSNIPEQNLIIAFTELVGYLNLKFANRIPKKNNSIIPDTIEEMKNKYDFINADYKSKKLKDIESIHDIECDTVRSVIHSSLCSTKDKTSWAFQLFKIYQQYPETLLRKVINKLRIDRMASMKKSAALRLRGSTSSLLQSPMKLSMYYTNQLQNTKFTFKSLTEANSFINSFMQWNHSETTENYDITCIDHGASLIIENILQTLNLEVIFEHPEQVIILDPVLKEDNTYERILKKYYDILKAQNNINLEEHKENDESDDENIPHIEYESESTNVEVKNFSRIGFHMMRADMFDCNDKNNVQHMHDYFVVQASKMFLKSLNREANIEYERKSKKMVNKVINDIKNSIIVPDFCNKILYEDIKIHFKDIDLSTDDFEYFEKIKCHIYDAKEFGLTINQLKDITLDSSNVILNLIDVLDFLNKSHIILRVGISVLRYVHYDFKKPWLTHADKILRLEKEKMSKDLLPTKWKGKHILKHNEFKKDRKLKILVAPWVRLDGSLNRRVFDRWLATIVSLCVEEPGMKIEKLYSRITFLKQNEILFLIEQLVNIGCIKLLKVIKPKVTLFSDVFDLRCEEANIFDDPSEILIEPTEHIFINFALLMGTKNYNFNFVD